MDHIYSNYGPMPKMGPLQGSPKQSVKNLDPDHVQDFVTPDLGPNSLQ